MKKSSPPDRPSWLEQAYPQVHFLVLAQQGDAAAIHWLEENSHGVSLFHRALEGDRTALAGLQNGHGADLDDLFEVVDNEDLAKWLAERRPDLHLLFEAIKGDDEAVQQLRRKHAAHARIIPTLREVHARFLERQQREGMIEGETAADMGCLIGEMHLRQGEYEKAIEAFSRAIESQPAPDLFEGRARAYHGLAARDEERARQLRENPPERVP